MKKKLNAILIFAGLISSGLLFAQDLEELEVKIMQLGATLHSIKLKETENNFVEYFGK